MKRHVLPLKRVLLCSLCLFAAACAPERDPDQTAASQQSIADGGIDEVRAQLQKLLPELQTADIRASAVPGLYEVQHGSEFGYVTADGRFLIAGDLIDVTSGQSLTENRRREDRVAKLAAMDPEQGIVFAPQSGADPAHTVTVFTDIDCGYCRKLHREIEQYNAAGIAVRYLFYPRSGPGSESFRKAENVWCSTDRKQALTQAKLGVALPETAQCQNPVMADYELGMQLGLRGTPMIVLPDGEVVSGYVPAPVLAQRLNGQPQG